MKFADLCEVFETLPFPGRDTRAHPERVSVVSAKTAVAAAVTDDEFLVDCISREFSRIKSGRFAPGLVPFFTMPRLGVRFAFGYWPPGGTPGPHEHTAWTITAVCRNQLEVLTYDREESYLRRQLIPKNRFPAPAGKAGYIYEPCIHAPKNASNDWTLSFHVSSPRDGEPFDDKEPLSCLSFVPVLWPGKQDPPYTHVIRARRRQRIVHQLVRVLISTHVHQTREVLEACSVLASWATCRLIDRTSQRPDKLNDSRSGCVLKRTHKDLVLRHRDEGQMVALDAVTLNGTIPELMIGNQARMAIAFAAREQIFDVRALPGNLSEDEQTAIGDLLEETGLFTRVSE